MPWMPWAEIGLGGLISGAALVGVLALRKSAEPLMALVGTAGTLIAVTGIFAVSDAYGRSEITAIAVVLAVGCAGGGYGLASAMLPSLATHRTDPSLDGLAPAADRRIFVAVLAMVEPEYYEPYIVADELGDLSDAGMPETTIGVTPFLFAAQKTRYRAAGGRSPSASQAHAIVERLESLLPAATYGQVALVSCVGDNRLDVVVEQAARQGYARFVIADFSAGESHVWDRARDDLENLRPEDHGLAVVYTTPLWSAEGLAEMMVERVARFAHDTTTTGVALVMHGQSDFRARRQPQFEVQENSFANRVRVGLVEHGITDSNVRLCVAEWGTPDVVETVRHLAALGATRILVVPVCYPFESIATVLDFSVAIRQARVSPHVYVTTLTAWGDDPVVAETLRSVVEQAAGELPA